MKSYQRVAYGAISAMFAATAPALVALGLQIEVTEFDTGLELDLTLAVKWMIIGFLAPVAALMAIAFATQVAGWQPKPGQVRI